MLTYSTVQLIQYDCTIFIRFDGAWFQSIFNCLKSLQKGQRVVFIDLHITFLFCHMVLCSLYGKNVCNPSTQIIKQCFFWIEFMTLWPMSVDLNLYGSLVYVCWTTQPLRCPSYLIWREPTMTPWHNKQMYSGLTIQCNDPIISSFCFNLFYPFISLV